MIEKINCMRCKGRKILYKVGGAYSFLDTGGILVNCPMCSGEGKIKSLENALSDDFVTVEEVDLETFKGNKRGRKKKTEQRK